MPTGPAARRAQFHWARLASASTLLHAPIPGFPAGRWIEVAAGKSMHRGAPASDVGRYAVFESSPAWPRLLPAGFAFALIFALSYFDQLVPTLLLIAPLESADP